ncbi:MAG: AAA family ATPase, partial [Sutterellaceae bacterium]|nr:AAA family ATPase [Sutterellaceae bacterium]
MLIQKVDARRLAVVSLLTYASDIARIKRKTALTYKSYDWSMFFSKVDGTLPGVKKWEHASGNTSVLLSITQQTIPRAPRPDKELEPWLGGDWGSTAWIPAHAEFLKGKDDTKVSFSEIPLLQSLWNVWIRTWKNWREDALRREQTQKLFARFFALQQLIEKSSLRKVAMAGNMFFMTDKAHKGICVPLLAQPVIIETDILGRGSNARSVLRVSLDTEEVPVVRTGIFNELTDTPFSQKAIGNIAKIVQGKTTHPFYTEEVKGDFNAFACGICPPDSRWADSMAECHPTESEPFWVCEEPMIWVQDRPSDLGEAARDTAQRILEGADVPDYMYDLACTPTRASGEPRPVPVTERERTIEEQLAAAGGESPEILFAKPSNREQLQIAEEVESGSGVLVQGPPGTGKTHTIANLIGHFLSEGKTVLVTSQKEKALTVLKEKIPEKLWPLCVSSLGGSADIQKTIADLIRQAGAESEKSLKGKAARLQARRKDILKSLSDTRKKRVFLLDRERKQFSLGGDVYTYSQLGDWLRSHSELRSALPASDCNFTRPFPMSRDELAELYRLCGTVKPVDESLIKAGLPKKETVPEPGKLRGILEEKEREGNRRKSIGIEAARAQTPDGAGGFCFSKGKYALIVGRQSLFKAFELKDEVQAFERTTPEHYPEWLWNVRAVGARKESAGTESFALNLWDRLLQVLDEIGRRVSEEALEGSRAKVVIPSSCDHDEAKAACARFISAGIGEPTWVQRTLTLRADCSAIKGITVGGKPPRNADDYRRVISFIEFRQKLPDLAELWDKLVGRAGGPLFETFGPESPELLAHDQYAKEITDALSWWRDHAKPVLEKMQDLGITVRTQSQFGIPQPIEVTRTLEEVYPKVLLWLQSCEAQSRLDQEFKDLLSVLSAETARAPAVAKPLKDCFEAKDVEGYEKNYLKLAELWKEEEDVGRLHAGFARLREVSPSWASRLASRDESLLGAGVPGKLLEAWDWGAKNIFFQQYRNENPAGIEKRGEELSKNLLKTTGSLVSCLAWLSLKDRFNDNPALLQGLRSWAQIMGMLGKGTGKNAPAIREKARRVMDRCQSGVPVWIMPMEQALRTFRGKKPFDVVIL